MNLAGNGFVALLRGDVVTAQIVFEAARQIEPQSKCLQALSDAVAERRIELEAAKTAGDRKKISREE